MGTLNSDIDFRVIEPGKPWWAFEWGEVWQYRHLLRFLVHRDLALIYKQTILGPIHLFIRPFVMTLLFQLIFFKIGKMSTDGVHPFLFYFANNVLWAFFAGTFASVNRVFAQGKGLMSKVYFPRIIPPIASVLMNAISMGIQFVFLVAIILYFWATGLEFKLDFSILLIWIPLLQVSLIAIGFGFLFACLTLRYRDLLSLSTVIVQGLLYLSPIIYPIASVPEDFRVFAYLNPLASAFESFRYLLFNQGTVNPEIMLMGWSITLLMLISGLIAFNLAQRKFVDVV